MRTSTYVPPGKGVRHICIGLCLRTCLHSIQGRASIFEAGYKKPWQGPYPLGFLRALSRMPWMPGLASDAAARRSAGH